MFFKFLLLERSDYIFFLWIVCDLILNELLPLLLAKLNGFDLLVENVDKQWFDFNITFLNSASAGTLYSVRVSKSADHRRWGLAGLPELRLEGQMCEQGGF